MCAIFKLKMHLRAGLCLQAPLGELTQAPDSLAGFQGALVAGEERGGKKGRGGREGRVPSLLFLQFNYRPYCFLYLALSFTGRLVSSIS